MKVWKIYIKEEHHDETHNSDDTDRDNLGRRHRMTEKESIQNIPQCPPIRDNQRCCYHMMVDWARLSEKSWKSKHISILSHPEKKGKQACFFSDSFYNAQAHIVKGGSTMVSIGISKVLDLSSILSRPANSDCRCLACVPVPHKALF